MLTDLPKQFVKIFCDPKIIKFDQPLLRDNSVRLQSHRPGLRLGYHFKL